MRSLGFGLERIGLAVLRVPIAASIAALLICAFAAATLPRLAFDGNIISVLSERSVAFKTFRDVRTDFRDFLEDVLVIVRSPDLATAKKMEALRGLHLDLELESPVAGIMSVFSFSRFNAETKTIVTRLPGLFTDDQATRTALEDLLAAEPSARSFLAPEKDAAALLVTLDPQSTGSSIAAFGALQASIADLAPDGFQVAYAGLPPIQVAIRDAILADQITLTIAGLTLGTLVALIVFGNIVSALICTIPALVATLWVLAMFAVTGTEINYLLTVLPTLAMVLAFADSIVLFFHWKRSLATADDALQALREAVKRVGPASAMTSITTALAIASFAYGDSEALTDFAWLGAASVMMAFLAFIIVLPLICYWTRYLSVGRAGAKSPALTRTGPFLRRTLMRAPHLLVAIGIGLVILMGLIHHRVGMEYRITAYLPSASPVYDQETLAGDLFGGSGRLFAVLQRPDSGAFHDEPVRRDLRALHQTAVAIFGTSRVGSLATLWDHAADDHIPALAANIDEADTTMVRNVLSVDRSKLLVTIGVDALESGHAVQRLITRFEQDLRAAGLADRVMLTGFPLLAAQEMPKLIASLRTGMLIAVALAIGIIMVASASPALGLACLVPNLIPILSVETLLWAINHDHDTTTVIALTIAFGIAIDNAIHVVNFYRIATGEGRPPADALKHAVQDVAPALIASTAILCVALVITQFSALPSIALLGRLMIITLVIALISNLLFLPAFIRLLTGLAEKRKA